jgi:hypothetical protein
MLRHRQKYVMDGVTSSQRASATRFSQILVEPSIYCIAESPQSNRHLYALPHYIVAAATADPNKIINTNSNLKILVHVVCKIIMILSAVFLMYNSEGK